MTYFADEAITLAASEVKGPSRDLIDNVGGSKASHARIQNHILSGTEVLYRFGSGPVPTTDPKQGHYLLPGDSVEINGYENIRDLRFALAGHTPASLFISYAA